MMTETRLAASQRVTNIQVTSGGKTVKAQRLTPLSMRRRVGQCPSHVTIGISGQEVRVLSPVRVCRSTRCTCRLKVKMTRRW
jgi:hypothetical protein